jgi:GTP-binding protein
MAHLTPAITTQASRTVAIVGRANVGKSTLFNRLIGARKAVVSSTESTTRDRIYGEIQWQGVSLTLIDAGGFEFSKGDMLAQAIQRHLRHALKEADLLLWVCDARSGLLPADLMILDQLRKANKPIALALNKLDERTTIPAEFFSLGLTPILPISALHGRGIGELLEQLTKGLAPTQITTDEPPYTAAPKPRQAIAVAIVGRQNVGKSSFLNALLREERVIVSPMPGTTRDAVDTMLSVNGQAFLLIDTAGLRHKRKVRDPIDIFSMSRSMEAIARCDVALVVLDATQGVTRDDQRIITKVSETGCGLILLVNKWDLMREKSEQQLRQALVKRFPSMAWAPVLAVSAITGFHVQQSLALIRQVFQAMRTGLSPEAINETLQAAWRTHPPPRYRGRCIRLIRARWIAEHRPARVELDMHPVSRLPRPYQHYLLKALYASRALTGVPVQLIGKAPPEIRRKDRR